MDYFLYVIGFAGIFVGFYELYYLIFPTEKGLPKFNPPPTPPKKRYRWNIYWQVWDEWDSDGQYYRCKYPKPFIVSRNNGYLKNYISEQSIRYNE